METKYGTIVELGIRSKQEQRKQANGRYQPIEIDIYQPIIRVVIVVVVIVVVVDGVSEI